MSFQNKKISILGMGRSALGAAQLLLREGALPFVSDHADTPAMEAWKAALDALKVPWECGGHSDRALKEAEMIVLSPGRAPRPARAEGGPGSRDSRPR